MMYYIFHYLTSRLSMKRLVIAPLALAAASVAGGCGLIDGSGEQRAATDRHAQQAEISDSCVAEVRELDGALEENTLQACDGVDPDKLQRLGNLVTEEVEAQGSTSRRAIGAALTIIAAGGAGYILLTRD
jgi:hypothetical protein